MKRFMALALYIAGSSFVCGAQRQPACPSHSVIGVCLDKNVDGCSSRELKLPVWYEVDPQYTEEAADANVKGTVVLFATVGADGCAHEIRVARVVGYGLEEAAIAALKRFRLRRMAEPVLASFEFNFDPRDSSRIPVTVPTCEDANESNQPDDALFNRAIQAVEEKKFADANILLQTLVNTYPDSQYAGEAKRCLQDPQIAKCGQPLTFFGECRGSGETTETPDGSHD